LRILFLYIKRGFPVIYSRQTKFLNGIIFLSVKMVLEILFKVI